MNWFILHLFLYCCVYNYWEFYIYVHCNFDLASVKRLIPRRVRHGRPTGHRFLCSPPSTEPHVFDLLAISLRKPCDRLPTTTQCVRQTTLDRLRYTAPISRPRMGDASARQPDGADVLKRWPLPFAATSIVYLINWPTAWQYISRPKMYYVAHYAPGYIYVLTNKTISTQPTR